MLRVTNIRKNKIVSTSFSSKNKFKIVFESDNFVITKSKMFVKNGCLYWTLKMNVMSIIIKDENNNKIDFFICLNLADTHFWVPTQK